MFGNFELFKVLGVETRVKIIEILKTKGPIGAKTIAEELGITVAAVSQHLKVLKSVGFVINERQGYCIPYSINKETLKDCHGMVSKVCNCKHDSHCSIEKPDLKNANLGTLLDYKKKLEDALKDVQSKIDKLSSDS